MSTIVTTGLTGLPSLAPNDDLATLLLEAIAAQGTSLHSGDVLVIAQKAISKVENRYVDLNHVSPSSDAITLAQQVDKDPRLVELILQESSTVVRAVTGVLIVRHHSGHVMANAGIDASNLPHGDDTVLLLPKDSNASAAQLKAAIKAKLNIDIAVVISDSFGRPWRQGVTNVAIGSAGICALFDRRNEEDMFGRTLRVTQVATGDLLASSAGLVMGEGKEGIPAAIIRGLAQRYFDHTEHCTATDLVRPANEDLFR